MEENKKGFWETFKGWFQKPQPEDVVLTPNIKPEINQDKVRLAPEEAKKAPIPAAVPDPPKDQSEPVKLAVPAYKEKVYKVTGMSHYMDGIMNLAEENEDYDLKKKELIEYEMTDRRIWKYAFSPSETTLVPEPDNPEDPKAIKVLVNSVHVGYIKAGSCAHLLKMIREDRIVDIDCEMYGGPYKYVSEEWDDEKDKFVYEFEKSEVPYGVKLTITEK